MLHEFLRLGMGHVMDNIMSNLSPRDVLRISWTSNNLRVYVNEELNKKWRHRLDFENSLRRKLPPLIFEIEGTRGKPGNFLAPEYRHGIAHLLQKDPPRECKIAERLVKEPIFRVKSVAVEVEELGIIFMDTAVEVSGVTFGFHSEDNSGVSLYALRGTAIMWKRALADKRTNVLALCAGVRCVYTYHSGDLTEDMLYKTVISKYSTLGEEQSRVETEAPPHSLVQLELEEKSNQLVVLDTAGKFSQLSTFDAGTLKPIFQRATLLYKFSQYEGFELFSSALHLGYPHLVLQSDFGFDVVIFDCRGEILIKRSFYGMRCIAHTGSGSYYAEYIKLEDSDCSSDASSIPVASDGDSSDTASMPGSGDEKMGTASGEPKPPTVAIFYVSPVRTLAQKKLIESGISKNVIELPIFEDWPV